MTNSPEQPWQEEHAVAAHLIQRVCERGSGRAEVECLRNYPRDRYFIGNLRPVAPEETIEFYEHEDGSQRSERDSEDDGDSLVSVESSFLRELRQKLAPVAFGADLRVAPDGDEARLFIKLRWSSYYRIFPTRSQQSAWQNSGRIQPTHPTISDEQQGELAQAEESVSKSIRFGIDDAVSSGSVSRHRRISIEDMCPRFRKIVCAATGDVSVCRDNDRWQIDTSALQSAINAEVVRAQEAIAEDSERFRTAASVEDKVRVPLDCLDDDASYETFLSSLRTEMNIEWRWGIHVVPRLADPGHDWIIGMQFANRSPVAVDLRNVEGFFFDTGSTFRFKKGTAQAFDLAIVPRGFRYDRRMWGRGFNCAVRKIGTDDGCWFETTHTPVYTQGRYQTRTDPPATFASLSMEPLPVLQRVHSAMNEYLQVWQDARAEYRRSQSHWDENYAHEFDADFQMFQDEIARFPHWHGIDRDRFGHQACVSVNE